MSTGGSVSLINIVVAIPLVAAGGTAIDIARITRAKANLQQLTDGAALAASAAKNAKGMNVHDEMENRAKIATYFLANGLQGMSDMDVVGTPIITVGPNTVDITVKSHVKASVVSILSALPDPSSLGGGGNAKNNWDATFSVSSKAGHEDERYLCLLSLDPAQQDAVYFQGNSKFMATCGVQANSNNAVAIRTWGNAYAYAYNFCAVGGWSGSGFSPDPVGGCTANPDPYAAMALPTPAVSCSAGYSNVTVKSTSVNLTPGTYCGGLTITTNGIANLAPGLYIIKDGKLDVSAQGTLNAPSWSPDCKRIAFVSNSDK